MDPTEIQHAKQEGIAEGALQARREVLEQLILIRLGSVPAPLADRIATADRETLDRLLNRAALANSLDELDAE